MRKRWRRRGRRRRRRLGGEQEEVREGKKRGEEVVHSRAENCRAEGGHGVFNERDEGWRQCISIARGHWFLSVASVHKTNESLQH